MNLSVICVLQIICRIHGRHLHQRVEQHKHSVVGKHFMEKHEVKRVNRGGNFKILKKCRGKLECLILEILIIRDKRPTLNTQSNSIRAKLFQSALYLIVICLFPRLHLLALFALSFSII